MDYQPPTHLLEVLQKIEYEQPLDDDDPRFVETAEARGSDRTFIRLARKFGWDPERGAFFPPTEKHVLFFGHIGSGKTTELRRYAVKLNASRRFHVIEVDVLTRLDRNNLQYSEVLLAMAESLLEQLRDQSCALPDQTLQPLRAWFMEASRSHIETNELSAAIETSAQAGAGIPGLIQLLARFTAGFKTGSSIKKEWREEIRNRFSDLARAFNSLIRASEAALQRQHKAERLLFLIDGTDKLRGEDTQRFFVEDAEQLLAIQALAIYTAPLQLKFDGRLGGRLDADMVLPMIKLEQRDGQPFAVGRRTLRDLLLRRADQGLFASEAEVEHLVSASGGHPRELLHLLKLCCELADDRIDAMVVRTAIDKLAAEYRYFLNPGDYVLLKTIDSGQSVAGHDERAQDLMHRLALLQYNDGGWCRSHPVVRTLEGYQRARISAGSVDTSPARAPTSPVSELLTD
ncbi:MAG: hypothetical protein ACK5N0_08130 [Synechococcaceae cyanobacterium]